MVRGFNSSEGKVKRDRGRGGTSGGGFGCSRRTQCVPLPGEDYLEQSSRTRGPKGSAEKNERKGGRMGIQTKSFCWEENNNLYGTLSLPSTLKKGMSISLGLFWKDDVRIARGCFKIKVEVKTLLNLLRAPAPGIRKRRSAKKLVLGYTSSRGFQRGGLPRCYGAGRGRLKSSYCVLAGLLKIGREPLETPTTVIFFFNSYLAPEGGKRKTGKKRSPDEYGGARKTYAAGGKGGLR